MNKYLEMGNNENILMLAIQFQIKNDTSLILLNNLHRQLEMNKTKKIIYLRNKFFDCTKIIKSKRIIDFKMKKSKKYYIVSEKTK